MSRSLEDKTNDIIRCYTQFGDEIKELIAYDIANNIYKLGIKVTGDSCSRFLMSSQSCRIDTSKVSKFLEAQENEKQLKEDNPSCMHRLQVVLKGRWSRTLEIPPQLPAYQLI